MEGLRCDLSALSPSERSRREELVCAVQARAHAVRERESGFRIALPQDPDACALALELVLLERRCCPFLHFDLKVAPEAAELRLEVAGPPGAKDFLREGGLLGWAAPAAESDCF